MAFVPFSRKMVRTAASSEPAAQAESLPFMSLVDASSKQHEDGEPEQMMRQLSIRDQEQGEDFNQNNVQQVLEHNIALRRNFDDLKHLHLQLTESNAQLQDAFLRLQEEKEAFEKAASQAGELKQDRVQLLASMEELKRKQEDEVRCIKSERDQAMAKAGEMVLRIQNLEKKTLTHKTENKELSHKIEVLRMEKEQSLVVKHCAEMDFARALAVTKAEDEACRQQAADFAHKCKHLELDLKKALEAAECAHQQLITTTHNKDAAISELEQALRKLEEKLYNVEEKHKTMEKDWEREQKKLQHVIEDKERHELQMLRAKEEAEIQLREECEQCIKQIKHEKEESEWQWKEESECHVKEALMEARIEEERQRDLRRTLEGEAADLRAMLTAVEQASTDAEARHTESENQLTKECELLQNELSESKEKLKEATSALLGLQKEYLDLMTEVEGLHAQLNDALNRNHETFSDLAMSRNMQNECEKQLEQLKNTVHELRSQQEKDHIDEGNRLEDAKRRWEAEKGELKSKELIAADEQRKKLSHKNHYLKRKLKERNKLLAMMRVEHNQLLVHLREIETHLSIAQTTKLVYASNPSTRITPRYSKTFVGGNLSAAWLKSEMTELERRQSQYRPFHKHEAKIPADTEHLKVPVIDRETTAPTWK